MSTSDPRAQRAADGLRAELDAARRVVDAARAWRQWYGGPRPTWSSPECNDLAAAVDALDEGNQP